MSDHWTILIPEEPEFLPSEQAQHRAVALFQKIAPMADKVTTEVSAGVRFIDCGSNFERILCPDCGAEIALDWWQAQMDSGNGESLDLQPVQLPCCGTRKNLNQLDYEWPQGFARFSLEAMNANIGDLPEQKKAEFEKILGCRLRKILRHL